MSGSLIGESPFPLSLFYFHQLPLYFWLTNIFIIPLVWLIIVCTIVFFLFTGLDPIQQWISVLLDTLLKFLNLIIDGINLMPFAAIQDIRFETSHMVTLYLVLLGILIFHRKKKRLYLI